MDDRDRGDGNDAMRSGGEDLLDRLGALEMALRRAVFDNRIGAIKSMDVLVRCHGPALEPVTDMLLQQADAMFGVERHHLQCIGGDPEVLLLGTWAQGQIATVSVGRADGPELVDVVVMGSKGSLAHRWTGYADAAL